MSDIDLEYMTVAELKDEAERLASEHAVPRIVEALADTGQLRRNSPLFEEAVRISDWAEKAIRVAREHEDGHLTDEEAEAALRRIIDQLQSAPPQSVVEAMQNVDQTLLPNDLDLQAYLVQRLEYDIDRNIRNSQRIAQYGVAEAQGDAGALDINSPLRSFLLTLDVVAADAHEIREQYELQLIDGIAAVMELLKLRDYSLATTEEMAWKPEGRMKKLKAAPRDLVFKLYDEIAFAYESHPAVVARRKGTASEEQLQVSAYLTDAHSTAQDIKELEREGQLSTSIALRTMEKILADMKVLVPDIQQAGKKLPRAGAGAKLPRITQPGALDALAEYEGPEWKSRQESDHLNPKGFYANLDAVQILRGLGEDGKGLTVADMLDGGGAIQGDQADYLVAPSGALKAVRKQGTEELEDEDEGEE